MPSALRNLRDCSRRWIRPGTRNAPGVQLGSNQPRDSHSGYHFASIACGSKLLASSMDDDNARARFGDALGFIAVVVGLGAMVGGAHLFVEELLKGLLDARAVTARDHLTDAAVHDQVERFA